MTKVRQIPFKDLTVGALMELRKSGVRAIVDGDKRVIRIISQSSVQGTRVRKLKAKAGKTSI
jgi:hypothetical protein